MADTNGTPVLIDALKEELSALRVYEVDAGKATPVLVGSAPVAILDTAFETMLRLLVMVAAREPGMGAHVVEQYGAVVTAALAAFPELIGTLDGRTDAWLNERDLVPYEEV